MKIAAIAVSFVLAIGTAFAADEKADKPKKEPSAAQKAQRERMKDCNAKAAGQAGDERKAFMKQCLSGGRKPAAAGPAGCEERANAKKLHGAARASFVKSCQAGNSPANN